MNTQIIPKPSILSRTFNDEGEKIELETRLIPNEEVFKIVQMKHFSSFRLNFANTDLSNQN